MDLELKSVHPPVPPIQATVTWDTLDTRDKHTNVGRVRFADAESEFRLRLVRTRFGSGISIYAITDQMTVEELAPFETIINAMPLPEALQRFVGGTFVLDGAPGGKLRKQIQGIELIGEVPEGYRGHATREALYRSLDADETRGVFGAIGLDLSAHEFESLEDVVREREREREARRAAR